MATAPKCQSEKRKNWLQEYSANHFITKAKKSGESLSTDPELNAMIRLRYKDTSKYLIWLGCPFRDEYIRINKVSQSQRRNAASPRLFRSLSAGVVQKDEECSSRIVDIEDDKTPLPERSINSVRRSESSDEDEPIIRITSSTDSTLGDSRSEEPDLRVWRL